MKEAAVSDLTGPEFTKTKQTQDHVGGAEVWYENNTRIWATENLAPHFFKQYGVFRQAEALRAARQFGMSAALSELPCSGLGRKPDVDLTAKTMAFLMPTDTFLDRTSFTVRGCACVSAPSSRSPQELTRRIHAD